MEAANLAKKFNNQEYYQEKLQDKLYQFLPFRFSRLNDKVFLSNEVGEYCLIENSEFKKFASHELNVNSNIYHNLKAKHFLFDDIESVSLDLLGIKLRTKFQHIHNFTSLHMFVVSLRCDYSCKYCQVSRQSEDKSQFDMKESTALKGIDFVFESPSQSIKIEFQGGESLLNFSLIKFIVIEAKKRNEKENRDLEFVIATNLSFLSDEIIEFCSEHGIYISTSLDGPEHLHNKNRARPGRNGYELTTNAIARIRDTLGPDKISALMTTTEASLNSVKEIIDEYMSQGFNSIFLRPLSAYGFAVKTREAQKYDTSMWLEFYKEGLDYIIELNKKGIFFRETYASIILTKILTPYNPGYVDLQSPAGAGSSAVIFNYDGKVYVSDEARMLAEMGVDKFLLGNLDENTYAEIMGSDVLLDCLAETITESVPMCRDCAYQPYCGADPVRHFAAEGDWVGHKAKSGFCNKNMSIFEHLIGLLESDSETKRILTSWIRT